MYSPSISESNVRRLYRLGRVRRVPMTKLVNKALADFLARHEDEIESYNPETHDTRSQERVQRAA